MPPVMPTVSEEFRAQIEAFLATSGFKPSEFGRQAVGDRSFVLNLRRGRSPTLATVDRVLAFIRGFETRPRRRARTEGEPPCR